MNLVVGMTGASGVLATKLLLQKSKWPVTLVASKMGRVVYEQEAGPFAELEAILETLNRCLPRLARVNLYANGRSIASKTAEQLHALRGLKLHTLYMGLESGNEEILQRCLKILFVR